MKLNDILNKPGIAVPLGITLGFIIGIIIYLISGE